jgi:preprotein translocase subunit YajC
MIRPQQKRQKEHQEMIKNVRRGDQIVMSGGLIGKVVKVTDDNELELEIADNVRVRVSRSAIADVRSKGEPVKS